MGIGQNSFGEVATHECVAIHTKVLIVYEPQSENLPYGMWA